MLSTSLTSILFVATLVSCAAVGLNHEPLGSLQYVPDSVVLKHLVGNGATPWHAVNDSDGYTEFFSFDTEEFEILRQTLSQQGLAEDVLPGNPEVFLSDILSQGDIETPTERQFTFGNNICYANANHPYAYFYILDGILQTLCGGFQYGASSAIKKTQIAQRATQAINGSPVKAVVRYTILGAAGASNLACTSLIRTAISGACEQIKYGNKGSAEASRGGQTSAKDRSGRLAATGGLVVDPA